MSDIKKYEPLWNTWYIESMLGKGSFGKVYKVRREAFGKVHYSAVKLITIPQEGNEIQDMENEGLDPISIQNFFHALLDDIVCEIHMMNELRGNSNIVSFEDYQVIENPDSIGWDILIRMELLDDLSKHFKNAPLSRAEILKVGIHICRALELCAQKNIIHRDIKPENIFISQYGEYKLGDFGIARQLERTMSGLSQKGTCNYMAPEVFRGDPYGADVDTYSLGIVIYRLLNQGRVPFLPDFPHPILPRDRDNALQARMSGQPLPTLNGVSPQLNAIIQKACAYNRHARYSSPAEMREDLEVVAGIKKTSSTLNAMASINPALSANVTSGSPSDSTEVCQPGDTPTYALSSHSSPTVLSPTSLSPGTPPPPYTTPPAQPFSPAPAPAPLNRTYKGAKSQNIALLSACGILMVALVVFLIFTMSDSFRNSNAIAQNHSSDEINTQDEINSQNEINTQDKVSDTPNPDDQTNKLYETLSYMIIRQSNSNEDELPVTFTFTVKILSETETRTENGQERVYQRATIAREANKDFLLDVNDLKEYPKVGSIVSVTSTSCNTIEWVANNQKKSLLTIKADSIQPVKPKNLPVNTGPTMNDIIGRGITNTIEFKDAHFSQNNLRKKVIILYYNFTNRGSDDAEADLNCLDRRPYMFLGDNDECLEDSIFTPKEIDGQALNSILPNETAPGKTTYYYSIFEVPDNNKDSRLYIKKYDDDFNLTDNIVLDVASSLAQMKR